jgi:hypothetical protein
MLVPVLGIVLRLRGMDIPTAKEKQPTDENKLSKYCPSNAIGKPRLESPRTCTVNRIASPSLSPINSCIKLTDPSADTLLLFTSLCCTPTSENAVSHLGNPFMLGSNGGGEESAKVRAQSPRKIRNRPPSHSGDFPDYSSVPQPCMTNHVARAPLSFEREDPPFEHNFSARSVWVAVSRDAESLPKLEVHLLFPCGGQSPSVLELLGEPRKKAI